MENTQGTKQEMQRTPEAMPTTPENPEAAFERALEAAWAEAREAGDAIAAAEAAGAMTEDVAILKDELHRVEILLTNTTHATESRTNQEPSTIEMSDEKRLDAFLAEAVQATLEHLQKLPPEKQLDVYAIENEILQLPFDKEVAQRIMAPYAGKEEEIRQHVIHHVNKLIPPEGRLGVLKGMGVQPEEIFSQRSHLEIPENQMRLLAIELSANDFDFMKNNQEFASKYNIQPVEVIQFIADHQSYALVGAIKKLQMDTLDDAQRQEIVQIAKAAAKKEQDQRIADNALREEIQRQERALQDKQFERTEAPMLIERTRNISQRLTETLKKTYPDRLPTIDARTKKEAQLSQEAVAESGKIEGSENSPEWWRLETGGAAAYKARAREKAGLRDGIEAGTYAAREWLAFQIDQALQLNIVPVTVLRQGQDGLGSVQEWKNDTAKTAMALGRTTWIRLAQKADLEKIGLLDVLTKNSDRHEGNFLVDATGKVHAIDNGLTFSKLNIGGDLIRSRPLDVVSEKPLSAELMDKINSFSQLSEVQDVLHEAFQTALGNEAETAWNRFQRQLNLLQGGGTLPRSDW